MFTTALGWSLYSSCSILQQQRLGSEGAIEHMEHLSFLSLFVSSPRIIDRRHYAMHGRDFLSHTRSLSRVLRRLTSEDSDWIWRFVDTHPPSKTLPRLYTKWSSKRSSLHLPHTCVSIAAPRPSLRRIRRMRPTSPAPPVSLSPAPTPPAPRRPPARPSPPCPSS